MADLISRLKLESGEFDSKIKRAGQELMAYSEHCRKTGLQMGFANQDAKDFAKALGNMETTSRTTRGKINELTEAFVNLKVMYKNMTDEEKNNTFGKNLAASLDQLKTRIDQAKTELNSVNAELGNTKQAEVDTKGGLDGLTSALGINIKTLTGWGTAIAAGKVALDVAKDAFFASESSVDEWGRSVAASQSLYEGFLTAINNGDISGYLDRMGQIVQAAHEVYNELDTLGTMKTIQTPQKSRQQAENERIRSMIQTGRYIAPQDGRRNAVFNGREMQTGDKLTAGRIRVLEKQLQGGMQKMVKLVGNEVDQTGKAINAYYDKLAKTNGMSLQEFKKGTSSWEEFSKRMQGYEQYKRWNEQASIEFAKQGGRGFVNFDKSNPFAEFRKWGTFRVDKEGDNSYKDLVSLIQQRDQQVGQLYSTQVQAYRTMNRAEGVTVSKLMKGDKSGKTSKPTVETKEKELTIQQQIANLEEEAYTATDERRQAIAKQVQELDKQLERQKAIRDEVHGIVKETKALTPVQGLSGFNAETMKAWMSGRQSDLSRAEYGSTEYTDIAANIADAQTIKSILETSFTNGIDTAQFDLSGMWEKVFDGQNIDDKVWQNLINTINEKLQAEGKPTIEIDFKTGNIKKVEDDGKKLSKEWQSAGSAIQAVGQAMSQIEDPAAKVMGTIAQAIATIALTFAKSLEKTFTPWDWIAAAAAGTATMISTISAIHSATGYAQGGVIKGNSYSGDNIGGMVDGGAGGFVGLDAGEIVLNRAQAGVIASQLSGNPLNDINLTASVEGEKIVLAAKRYFRRTNKSESALFR